MDAQSVWPDSEHNGWKEELLDLEEPDGIMLYEDNCKENNVNSEEAFPDPCEQGFIDGYVKGQTDTNDEI